MGLVTLLLALFGPLLFDVAISTTAGVVRVPRPRLIGRIGLTLPARLRVTDWDTRSPFLTGWGRVRASGVQ